MMHGYVSVGGVADSGSRGSTRYPLSAIPQSPTAGNSRTAPVAATDSDDSRCAM
jgi:hypothetical protein